MSAGAVHVTAQTLNGFRVIGRIARSGGGLAEPICQRGRIGNFGRCLIHVVGGICTQRTDKHDCNDKHRRYDDRHFGDPDPTTPS